VFFVPDYPELFIQPRAYYLRIVVCTHTRTVKRDRAYADTRLRRINTRIRISYSRNFVRNNRTVVALAYKRGDLINTLGADYVDPGGTRFRIRDPTSNGYVRVWTRDNSRDDEEEGIGKALNQKWVSYAGFLT